MIAVYRDNAGWMLKTANLDCYYTSLADCMADAYAADWSANHGEIPAVRDGAGHDG
jgi:hypothetical protein